MVEVLTGLSGREKGFMFEKGLCVEGGVSNMSLNHKRAVEGFGPSRNKSLMELLRSCPQSWAAFSAPLRQAANHSWVYPKSSRHVQLARRHTALPGAPQPHSLFLVLTLFLKQDQRVLPTMPWLFPRTFAYRQWDPGPQRELLLGHLPSLS